jgi:hypothetical protein
MYKKTTLQGRDTIGNAHLVGPLVASAISTRFLLSAAKKL